MTWWISIIFYLWQNSVRRWIEQPLSLLGKLVISCLLGVLGAVVILGIKHLGRELDRRLTDREVLSVVITEAVPQEQAPGMLVPGGMDNERWDLVGDEVLTFFQASAVAEIVDGRRVAVWAVSDLERHRMVDDFFLLSDLGPEGQLVEFEIAEFGSAAWTRRPDEVLRPLLNNRDGLIGGSDRLAALLAQGFTKTVFFRAKSVDAMAQAHEIVDALRQVEDRRVLIQSNLRVLRELEKIREVQGQALLWVTLGSSVVLGLVFGSLAWMEFREERYLLSLIRSFGVSRGMLLAHAAVENCLIALSGVLLGLGILRFSVGRLDLVALKMTWLSSIDEMGAEGRTLLIGAAVGGLLACVPVAIGLRRPLGLVLK